MPKRILIVDDECHVRILLEHALTPLMDEGVEVLVAKSAQEALSEASRAAPDLVFVDASMPDMSGSELCQRLRSEPTTRNAHIVVLAEKHQENEMRRCLTAGANDSVVKPFDPDDVLRCAGQALAVPFAQ